MDVLDMLLTNHNRSKKKLVKLKGVVMHWTGNTGLGANAMANRNYFNNTSDYVSAHYIVDDSKIVRCIPDNEVAYHVGAKKYTDIGKGFILNMNGKYYSPNYFLIGIEMCVNRDSIWENTYKKSVELAAFLLTKYSLSTNDLYRHYDITGKDCPRMMIEKSEWERFKSNVNIELNKTHTTVNVDNSNHIKIIINDKLLDVDVIVKENRTYVPLRKLFESLDAKVEWDDVNKAVVIKSAT